MQVLHYLDYRGYDVYQDWLDRIRDITGRVVIQRRIDRIANTGNVGKHDFCREGVWELKIDVGPGYRVYYVEIKKTVVLCFCAAAPSEPRTETSRARCIIGKIIKNDHENYENQKGNKNTPRSRRGYDRELSS